MKETWTPDGSQQSEKEAKKIGAIAEKRLNSMYIAPTKEVLSDEYKSYIEQSFPKTNEDTIQEDYAQNIVLKGGYDGLEKRHEMEAEGQKVEKEKNKEINKQYEDLVSQHEIIKQKDEALTRINNLKNSIDILKIQRKINPRFSLSKSGSSSAETVIMIDEALDHFLSEMVYLKEKIGEETNREKINELIDKYTVQYNKYIELNKTWFPENKELN